VVGRIEVDHFGPGEKQRRGIDGVAPTWDRRGRRSVGGQEAAERDRARPVSTTQAGTAVALLLPYEEDKLGGPSGHN
jgi:hypothetical protein